MNTTDYPSAVAVSNYQYEDSLQEKKRQIRLIQPRYIKEFVKEFESKLNDGIIDDELKYAGEFRIDECTIITHEGFEYNINALVLKK